MSDAISKAYTLIPNNKEELKKVLELKWPIKADAKANDPNAGAHTKMLKLYDNIISRYPKLNNPFAFQTHASNKTIKVIRLLELDKLQLPSLPNGKIEFGNGSRNGQGINNQGLKYENQLAKALSAYSIAGKEGLSKYPSFISTVNLIIKELPAGEVIMNVIAAGKSNSKRKVPITESGIHKLEDADINIGKKISDITVITQGKAGQSTETYISAKFGDTVSFLNLGIKQWFPEKDIVDGEIREQGGKDLLKLLAIDHQKFCDSFNDYKKGITKKTNIKVPVTAKINNPALINLVKSTVGYGYIMVHKTKSGVTVKKMNQATMDRYLKIDKVDIQYPTKGSSKLVKAKVKLVGLDIDFVIRATNGSVYPTHMVANYTYTKL